MDFARAMGSTEYLSSSKVIFSDRGSITFGILVIILMVSIAFGLFALKFQKKTAVHASSKKYVTKESVKSARFKHHFLFKPSQVHSLLLLGPTKNHSSAQKSQSKNLDTQ